MKTIHILLILLIVFLIYNLLPNCGCNLIEGIYTGQTNPDKTIQKMGILSDNCLPPNISPTRPYACTQKSSCFVVSEYKDKIDKMNNILKKDKREINLIGYLGGGVNNINNIPILTQIQDIPYYNTIILCYANFVGDTNNPSIVITGQFNVNKTYYYEYRYPSDCYKCSNCSPPKCKEYCSQYNFCENTPEHRKGGTDCTGCDYSKPINIDKNSQAFINNIKKWKSVDEYSYKGPKRKVLITFGGSANQMPQNLLKGNPNTSGTYTYNLLKQRSELDNKSILMSFLDTWNLDGIDLDYEFPGNLSGNSDDNLDTGVKNNWRHIIQHLKKYKKIVYATPYGKSSGTLQQQYNYLLNKNYMGEGNTIDVMQHQMYNGRIDWNKSSEKWYNYLEKVKTDIIPFNSNLTLESFGSVFTNYPNDHSINCWDLISYIEQIMDQIINNQNGNYVTNHGAFLIEYDYYYGYYFGKLIDSIRVNKIKPRPNPNPSPKPKPTPEPSSDCLQSGKSCGGLFNKKICCAGYECKFPFNPFGNPSQTGTCQKKK